MKTNEKEFANQNSGRKPSNEVDVCGPKSGETGRPSIKRSGIDHCDPAFDAIDQMYSAQMSMNESEEQLKTLRPQVEEAVKELIRIQGLPKNFTGTIPYHGFKIIVSRPKSFTWEQNNQIQDPTLDYYKQLYGYYEKLQTNVKEARADLKRAGEKLEKAYPNSDSIKHGFRIAIVK